MERQDILGAAERARNAASFHQIGHQRVGLNLRQHLDDELIGVAAPVARPDVRILLLEGLGQRPQQLVHDHAGVDDDRAFPAGSVLEQLLPVRALVVEDLFGGERGRGGRPKRQRGGGEGNPADRHGRRPCAFRPPRCGRLRRA
jgi:hypothetical protein